MKKMSEVHSNHTEVISEVNFLKQEVLFLLTLLRKAYAVASAEEIKLLDGYWKEFEKCMVELEALLTKIQYEEEELGTRLRSEVSCVFNENDECQCRFSKIYKEVRLVKESFYDFIKQSEKISKHVLA